MSVETLTIVVSALGIVLTLGASLFAGSAWVVRRMDGMELRLIDRMDAGDEKLGARIDAVDLKLTTRIDALAGEVTEVKISIARLEGPTRHLVTATR